MRSCAPQPAWPSPSSRGRRLLGCGQEAPPSTGDLAVVLDSLGRSHSLLTIDDGRRRRHTLRLSPRHSEILLLLASTARGLSGDELAVLLYEEDTSTSTLRAELNRLRHLLGEELLASRPYRLMAELTADSLVVEALLATGDVAAALRRYRGPLAAGLGRARGGAAAGEPRGLVAAGRAHLG